MPQQYTRTLVCLAVSGAALLLAACGGGGGAGRGGGGGGGGGGGTGTVVVSGPITFDRPPFRTTPGAGLNLNAPVESPARHVVVEAIEAGSSQTVLASTTTDANGDYSVTVPASRDVFIRAKAQMLRTGAAPTWDFRVRNNANADALYALDGANFNTGSTNVTRNLRAGLGWGGTSYTTTRAAAPFAILDTVYRAKELILTASPSAVFPQLNLFWSTQNRPASPFCPDQGDIGTSSYVRFGSPPNNVDDCAQPTPGVDGIYVLGEFTNATTSDTDEFDAHVIAHEFGHYFEDRFSRSDSIGGSHGSGDQLDPRLAFGEGWGNAFSGMVQNDPAYRDSRGSTADGGFNLETDSTVAEGWFSEFSVGEILFDVYDAAGESGDNVALGFPPIFAVMSGPQVQTDAFTSIFSFARALRSANPNEAASVGTLLANEAIVPDPDDFGTTETNAGGVSADVIPIYHPVSAPGPVQFCSRNDVGTLDGNKLGNRRFFRLDVPSTGRTITIQVTGQALGSGTSQAVDPDIYVFRRGSVVAAADGTNLNQELLPQTSLQPGVHIVEIYDFQIDGSTTDRCMTANFQW